MCRGTQVWSSRDLELRQSIEAIKAALEAADTDARGFGDLPSLAQTRDLLSLFAKLQNEDLRDGILCLLRAIVRPER